MSQISRIDDVDTAMLYISQAADCLIKSKIIIMHCIERLDTSEETEETSDALNAFESLNARLYVLTDSVTNLLNNFQR